MPSQNERSRRTTPVGAEASFERVSERLLAEAEEVESGRMFGALALKLRGKVFAMVVKGELVVKLPAARTEALVASGSGRPFDPGHGRVLKEWVALRPRDEAGYEAYMREAQAFVESRTRR